MTTIFLPNLIELLRKPVILAVYAASRFETDIDYLKHDMYLVSVDNK